MSITRRTALGGITAAVSGLFLAPSLRSPFANSAAAAEDELGKLEDAARKEGHVLYYCNNSFDDWKAGFEKKYPEIELEIFVGASSDIANKLVTEGVTGARSADVILGTATQRKTFVDAGVVMPTQLPSEANYPKELLDPTGYYHPVFLLLIPILYNTNLLKDFPHDVSELADPKWKDKIAFDNPQNQTISAYFLSSRRTVWGDDKWKQWLNGLAANNIFRTPDATSAYEAVLRGERPLAIGTLNDVMAQAAGTPVAAGFYDGGVVPFVDHNWLGAKGANPNAGRLFMNFMASEEGQKIVAAGNHTPILNIDTPLAVNKLLPSGTTVFDTTQMSDYFADVDKYLDIYDSLWPQ